VQNFINLIPQFTICFGLYRPSSDVSLFWPKLLLLLPFVNLLKFFLKIFRHNFSHRITPVSLLCCRLLDHPCPAFAVTSVIYNPNLYCFCSYPLLLVLCHVYCVPTHPFLVYTLLLRQRMALLVQCVMMLCMCRVRVTLRLTVSQSQCMCRVLASCIYTVS
jgi:hypothetical protein